MKCVSSRLSLSPILGLQALLLVVASCSQTPAPDLSTGTAELSSLGAEDVDVLLLDPQFTGVAPDTLWIPVPGFGEALARLEADLTPLPEPSDRALEREALRLRQALQHAAYDAGALLSEGPGERSWTLHAELLELTPTARWLNEEGAESLTVDDGTVEIALRLDDPNGRTWMYLRDHRMESAPRRGEGYGTWYGHDIASFQRWATRIAGLVSRGPSESSP